MEFSSAIVPPAPDADTLFDDIFFSPIVDSSHNAGLLLLSLLNLHMVTLYLVALQRSCFQKKMIILMQLLQLQGLEGVQKILKKISPHKLVW